MADTKLTGKQYRSKPLKKVLNASNAGITTEVARAEAAYLNKSATTFATESVSIASSGSGAASINTPVTLLTFTGAAGNATATLAVPGAAGKLKLLIAEAGVINTQGANKTINIGSTNLLPASVVALKAVGDFALLISVSATKWQVISKQETPTL